MNKKILGDLLEFGQKSKIKASKGQSTGKFKFFTSSTIQDKFIDLSQYNEESIIIGTGGNPNIHYCNEPFSVSTDCLVLTLRSEVDIVLLKYIYLYLKYNMHILEKGFRGAGLKHISKKYVQQIIVPIFPISTQQNYIKKMEHLESLEYNIQQQIYDLNVMVKSYFLDKVGPNHTQYSTWPIYKIEELASQTKGSIRSGPFGSNLKHSEFTDEGIFVLGIDNAVQNTFAIGKERYISNEKYKELKRYTVYPNDVIITIMGTTGRSAVVPDTIGTTITTKHLATLTLNQNLCVSEYISYCIHSHPEILYQIQLKNKGAIMDGLNLGIIKNLQLHLPPISLQKQFKKVLKLKDSMLVKYREQLKEIQLLKQKVVNSHF
ncbi:restriction endonuclease subunit S [Bacillus subtilis]|uniref:restriction endonuclease subunit S n=1 Tax=Bacillus subtilis TaxID=1423 RepID=UPI001C23155A|nr:restriction endonuclease subunit S [Bacillus subtilis]MBU8751513.1 restriction endonuclease subunit S [Bacillus subtilis]